MRADLATLLLYACALAAAHADWKPQYASEPQEVQAWYNATQLTDAAAKRFGFRGCCTGAEVVHAQFKLVGGENPHWFYVDPVRHKLTPIPDDIIHWNESAPDNRPTLFRLDHDFEQGKKGDLTCFYPPSGGF